MFILLGLRLEVAPMARFYKPLPDSPLQKSQVVTLAQSSRSISSAAVLKCYDWATEMRNRGMCIITGFHSKLEKDVFHFLSKGTQPIIVVLGRKQYKNLPDELVKPLEEGRLLIVSVVSTPRHSVETALRRNRYIIENADEVVFGSLNIEGNLYPLYEEIKENKKHIIL